jgi:hypothetical protein
MDPLRFIDAYCERTDPSYWSEPINAVTNAAFMIAALVMAARVRGQGLPLASLLCGLLFVIGIGSFLFHTHAQVWAAMADTIPIVLFSLTYIFAANLHFWRLPLWAALIVTALYIPYTMLLTPLFEILPFFEISSFYWPLPLLIISYAILLRNPHPKTAKGLAIGSGILCLSLTFRSLDEPLCNALPFGTHFLWHILNAVMLGWMIEVYRRHMLAARAARG